MSDNSSQFQTNFPSGGPATAVVVYPVVSQGPNDPQRRWGKKIEVFFNPNGRWGSCSTSAKSTSSCSGSEKQKFKFREEDPAQLTEYHKNVFRLESEDQHMKRMDLLDQRADDLGRHKKRKDRREKVQKASSQRPITAEPLQILPPIPSEYNDDIDPEHEYMIELAEAMVDLDSFDDKHQLTYRVQGKQPVNEHALKLN